MVDKNKSDKKQVEFKITSEGSLGLLALGDIGLRAWRKVKRENLKNKKE